MQTGHGIFHICTVYLPYEYGCILNTLLRENWAWHISHWWGFSPVGIRMSLQVITPCKLGMAYFTIGVFLSSVSTNVYLHNTVLSKLGTTCLNIYRVYGHVSSRHHMFHICGACLQCVSTNKTVQCTSQYNLFTTHFTLNVIPM